MHNRLQQKFIFMFSRVALTLALAAPTGVATTNAIHGSIDISRFNATSGSADPLTSYVSHFAVPALGADGVNASEDDDSFTSAPVSFRWTSATDDHHNDRITISIRAAASVLPELSHALLVVAGVAALALMSYVRSALTELLRMTVDLRNACGSINGEQ